MPERRRAKDIGCYAATVEGNTAKMVRAGCNRHAYNLASAQTLSNPSFSFNFTMKRSSLFGAGHVAKAPRSKPILVSPAVPIRGRGCLPLVSAGCPAVIRSIIEGKSPFRRSGRW